VTDEVGRMLLCAYADFDLVFRVTLYVLGFFIL